MKKFYILFLVCALAITASYGQNVVILAQDHEDADILAIKEAVDAAWAGITSELVDPAALADWDETVWGQYDLCVMTENGGSSSMGNYAPIGIVTVPIVSLKAYGIKKTAPQWAWITGDADQWYQQPKDSSITDPPYEEVYSAVVVADHPIWGGWYTVDDEFQFTTSYNANEGDEAHIQCFDLSKSTDANIVSNATLLANNKFAADETSSPVDGWIWAVEESASSKAAVVWGIHHEFLNAATEAFFGIIQNSMAWVLGEEEMPWTKPSAISVNHATDYALTVFPNPVVETATIQFNLESPGTVYFTVHDLVGKTVFELTNNFEQGLQQINFNASDLAPGVYTYQIEVNGVRASDMLIVQ